MKESMYEALLKIAEGEPIEAVVIGEYINDVELYGYCDPNWREDYDDVIAGYSKMPIGQLLTLDEARPYLEAFTIDSSYVLAIGAWTAKSCIYSAEYDSGHWLMKMPRNPTAYVPTKAGN